MTIVARHSLKRGATLIAVFWIMAVMGLALVATVKISQYQSEVAGSQINGIEARQYAEMGINLAANPAVEDWDRDLLGQTFENGAGFNVKILSEGGRFNINYILALEDKALLYLIFEEWGIDFDNASGIVDALSDWVDSDSAQQRHGAEFEYYEGQGYLNHPFNRPFYQLDEMRLVRGMDLVEAANPNWRDWFTVWSSGGLDVNEAPAEFLAIATDTNVDEVATSLVSMVGDKDRTRDTVDDEQISVEEAMAKLGVVDPSGVIQRRLGGQDQVKRIESVGFAGSIRRKIVLIISNRSQNPTILDRKEVTIQ